MRRTRLYWFLGLAVIAFPGRSPALTGASVDESTGSARYALPLLVPPGNAGHQPDLVLAYDSGRARGGAGWIGIGWKLGVQSAISRSTARGVPYDYAGPLACAPAAGGPAHLCYAERFSLDGEELVPVGLEDGGTRQRYRTRRDDGRLIQRVLALDRWEIRDRAGNRTVYGSSAATQVRNPKNRQVFAWHVASSTDAWGNWLRYEYTAGDGVLYPTAVSYSFGSPDVDPHDPAAPLVATRRIAFLLDDAASGARPDVALDYTAGFRQAIARRLARIEVRAGPGLALVTRYLFEYDQEPRSDRSRLIRVTRQAPSGSGFSSLPPHTFEYTETTPGFPGPPAMDFAAATGLADVAASLAGTTAWGYTQQTRRLVDLNGDSLLDLYDWPESTPSTPGKAYLNDGTRLSGPLSWLPAQAGQPGYWWMKPLRLEVGSTSNLRHLAIELLDVNGDGFPDVASDGASIVDEPLEVKLGSAEGLRPEVKLVDDWGWPGEIEQIGVDLHTGESHPTRRIDGLVDLTGDGRADLFWRRSGTAPFGFAPALGNDPDQLAYRPGALDWQKPAHTAPLLSDVYAASAPPLYYQLAVEMYDVNGDGLVDHVNPSVGPSAVAFNYGAGFEAPAYFPGAVRFSTSGSRVGPTPSGVMCGDSVTADINGDGCTDHVWKAGDPWDLWVFFGTCDGRYTADPTRPYELAEAAEWPSTLPPGDCAFEPAQLVDVDGDGMPDYVHDLEAIYLNPGQPPGLLRRVVTPTGGVAEYEYAAAAQERAGGMPANPGLPMPRMLVKQLALRDTGSAVPVVERFRYAAAEYDRSEREFRGFGSVSRARMQGEREDSVVEHGFASGPLARACTGSLVREEIRSGTGALLRRTVHDYDASRGQTGTDGERWEKCLRIASRAEHLEGLGEAGKRVVRSEYRWQTSDPFNLLAQTDWGEEPVAGAAMDHAADGSQTVFEYLPADSPSVSEGWWVGSVTRRRVMDPPTAVAPRTWSDTRYSYTDPCDPAAPQRPVPGRPGRVEGWLDRPVAKLVDLQRTCRDAHGNPTRVRGPATPSAPGGAYQRTDYEPAFRVFPSRLVRGDADAGEPSLATRFTYGHEPGASCGGVRAAPAGLGLPCRETSPGGLVQASGYDEFGRIERLVEASGVVTSIAHRLPADPRSSAGTEVITAVTSPEGTFVSRAFQDGLGRPIRSETPGAASRSETIRVESDYDHAGRPSAVSLPSLLPRSASTRFTRFEFDALGRLTSRLEPDGRTQHRTSYLPLAQVDEVYFGPERQSYEERAFDGQGRLAWLETFADARGSGRPAGALRTRLHHDAAGRLVGVDDPVRSDPSLCRPSAAQPFELGASCGADARHEARIEYDSLGRRVWLVDPDASTSRFTYDDAGQLVRLDRAEGTAAAHVSTWAYDSLGRVTHRGFSSAAGPTAGISDASLTYYLSGPAIGSLRSVDAERPDGTDYAYGYDALGRLARREQVTDRLRFVTSYGYDSLGRPTLEQMPDGSFKAWTWDGARPREAGLIKDIRWNALGRATDYFSGYVRFHYAFDPQSARLVQIRASRNTYSAIEYLKLDLELDGLGRNVSLSGTVDGGELARAFEYDGLSRLTRARGEWERPLGSEGPVTWDFRYDPLGNLREQGSDGAAGGYRRSWEYGHPSKPHALSRFIEVGSGGVSQEHVLVDSAGRTDSVLRIGAGGVAWRDCEWNAQGLFRGIGGLQPGYSYDVFGARVMQKSGSGSAARRVIYVGDDFEYNDFDRWGNTLHRLGGELVASSGRTWTAPAQGALSGDAAWGGWILLAGVPLAGLALRGARSRRSAQRAWAKTAVAGGVALCLVIAPVPLGASPPAPDGPGSLGMHRADLLVHVRDHLGSVRVVVDYPQARVVEKRDYGPFGEPLEHRGAFELHHQYAGQLRDEDLDLEFAGARMYDRRWGRFLSPDPLAPGLGSGHLNRYAYALDRPTSLRDPGGLDPRADAENRAELVGPHIGETISVTASPGGVDLGTGALPGDRTLAFDIHFAIASALDTALLHAALEGIPLLGEAGAPTGGVADTASTTAAGAAIPPDFPRDPIVFLGWRPVRFLGMPVGWHSFLAVWDPATGGIYRQFSLAAPERGFDLEGDSDTYRTDRGAFEHPGGRNLIFPITPPVGLEGREFAARVNANALALELPDRYSVTGPYNSNWAATRPLSELGASYAIPDGLAPGAIPYVP